MMIHKIKKIKINNREFGVFIICIVVMTCITLYVNNFSQIRVDSIVEEAMEHSRPIQDLFECVEEDFNQSKKLVNKFISFRENLFSDEKMMETTKKEINSILTVFLEDREFISGYFYQLSTSQYSNQPPVYYYNVQQRDAVTNKIHDIDEINEKLKSEGCTFWMMQGDVYSSENEIFLLYISPIYQNENYVGFMGLQISTEFITDKIEKMWDINKKHYILLVSPDQKLIYAPFLSEGQSELHTDQEGYVDIVNMMGAMQGEGYVERYKNSAKSVYSYNRFSTGHNFIEVRQVAEKVWQSNILILLIAFFAIMIVALLRRNPVTNTTVFERVTDRIIKQYRLNLTPQSIKGQKAIIALHIGMAGAILSDAIYAIVLKKELWVILEYFFCFLLVAMLMVFYTKSKNGITNRIAHVVSVLGLTLPVLEHVSVGGFEAGRAGESMLWLIAALFISLFIMGEKKSVKIFNLFVVILFLDLLIEIFLLKDSDYERIYNFTTSFFFLGLACFASMRIYVSGSERDYEKEEELITQLEANQSLIIKKEKMSTLGHLISGVAHDINTPIGAIKASTETMEVTFEQFLRTLMKAGEKWNEFEYECFEQLIVLSLYSKAQMRTTMEIRKAKKELKGYLEEEGIVQANEIAKDLARLEIIDMIQIEQNLILFKTEHIVDILKTVTELSSFLSGIPTTVYAADKVSKIVSALKSYVHTSEEGSKVEYDIVKSIDNVLILYHNELKVNIKLETEYEEELPVLYGNPDELAQVWTNLIQNAVYEMNEEGGTLKISVKKLQQSVVVMISDTGKGIPDHIKDKIFTPFFTTKERGTGNGLGLNIVKKIIDRHDGTIEVKSADNIGTQFIIRLPV